MMQGDDGRKTALLSHFMDYLLLRSLCLRVFEMELPALRLIASPQPKLLQDIAPSSIRLKIHS